MKDRRGQAQNACWTDFMVLVIPVLRVARIVPTGFGLSSRNSKQFKDAGDKWNSYWTVEQEGNPRVFLKVTIWKKLLTGKNGIEGSDSRCPFVVMQCLFVWKITRNLGRQIVKAPEDNE